MKLAVLSDIHGNLPALNAVLEHAGQQGIKEFIFTGDMVGHGPNPEGCIERLRAVKVQGIKGNNDKALLSNEADHNFYQSEANITLGWANTLLSNDSREWLRKLSDSAFEVGRLITVVHGTLMDPIGEYTYMYDNNSNIKMSFRNLKTTIGLFGHTHRSVLYRSVPKPPPFLFSFETVIPQYSETQGVGEFVYQFKTKTDQINKFLVCAGSIGQPRDGDPRTAYLVVDDKEQELSFYRLSYDLKATFRDFEEIRKRFPGQDKIIDDCIDRLKQGK